MIETKKPRVRLSISTLEKATETYWYIEMQFNRDNITDRTITVGAALKALGNIWANTKFPKSLRLKAGLLQGHLVRNTAPAKKKRTAIVKQRINYV